MLDKIATHHKVRSSAGSQVADVAIIGGGIVGACSALALQAAGESVVIYDARGPGAGASFGNAGLISADTCVPMSLPGTLAKVPGWLLKPDGPLSIDPAYMLKIAPWLLRFVKAGGRDRAMEISVALKALHTDSLQRYRQILGEKAYADFIRLSGQIHVLNDAGPSGLNPAIMAIWEKNGVETRMLDGDEMRQMLPALGRHVKHGIFFARNGYTMDPQKLTQTLSERAIAAGAQMRIEKAVSIIPEQNGLVRLVTNVDDVVYRKVIVAAGAWSPRLLELVGLKIPFDTERGYHVMLPNPGLEIRLPVVDRDNGFGVTPMAKGLRVAGTVEFAGLDKPPNLKRTAAMLRHAERLLPGLDTSNHKVWMGFRPSTPDSLPFIDRHPSIPNLHIASGNGHFGMTAGPMMGQLVAEEVLGRKTSIDVSPYRMSRFS